jgi:tetratricopeptide (TPR) repeat protein
MKKSRGETLLVALMPPHPAAGKTAASATKIRVCFQFNFTSPYTIVRVLMLATPISPGASPSRAGLPRPVAAACAALANRCCFVLCAVICVAGIRTFAQTDPRAPGSADFAKKAQKTYEAARAHYRAATNDPDAGGQFARACFDWADYATTDARRAEIAEEGIAVCQGLLKSATNSVPGHYYLAMNLGQLARTKSLGALKIVTQMEAEFNLVLELDPGYSFSGPDRNLGLLYLDAPNWPLSLGSNAKAREHLQKALKLAPDYPENHLNLIEAELEWGDKKAATAGLKALDGLWPDARKKLAGDDWAADWADWEKRRDAAWKQVRGGSSTGATGGK